MENIDYQYFTSVNSELKSFDFRAGFRLTDIHFGPGLNSIKVLLK